MTTEPTTVAEWVAEGGHGDVPIDANALAMMLDQVADEWIAPIWKRLVAAEKRLAEVETRGLAYRGIWSRAAHYTRGDVVTDSGSMFIASAPVDGERPGSDGSWVLCAKGAR